MNDKTEYRLLYFFLSLVVLVQLIFILLYDKSIGGADNITHYHIARYSFKYPQLLLDLWGKPVYSTLLAPFAAAGYKTARIFNVLVAGTTLFLLFRLSRKLYPKKAFFTVVFAAFAPVYFLLMSTCLTEPLFSLVLVVSVFLVVNKKYIPAAIVLSFIPFVRTEGFILFAVFAIALLLRGSYVSILFLSTGTLFYSLVGFFVFDDIFWIMHRFPYQMGENIYGSGELLHFVKKSDYIFGVPLIALIIIGLIYWTFEILKNFQLKSETLILYLIITGSWVIYFAAHSYVWWQGKSSLGLSRVIGGIVPLAALTGVKGIQFVFEKIRNKRIGYAIITFLAIAQVFLFFNQNEYPLKQGPIDKLIVQSSEYIKELNPDGRIYYFNPEFTFHLGLNPYDQTKSAWGVGDKLQPSNSMNFGDILIWDAHFGPNEGRVSIESLKNDQYLQEVKTFLPMEQITVLGGYDYAIHIFEKVKQKTEKPTSGIFNKKLELGITQSKNIINLDGTNVLEIYNNQEYSPSIVLYLENLLKKEIFEIQIRTEFKSDEIIKEKEVLLVVSVENEHENFKYDVEPLIWNKNDSGWNSTTLSVRFPADLPESATVKIYIWNRGHKHLYIKELESTTKSY